MLSLWLWLMALLILLSAYPTLHSFISCIFFFLFISFYEYMWFHNDNRIIFNTLFNLQMRVLWQHVKNTNFNGFSTANISKSFCSNNNKHSIIWYNSNDFYFKNIFWSIFIIYIRVHINSHSNSHSRNTNTYAYSGRKKNFWKTSSHLIRYKEKHQHSKRTIRIRITTATTKSSIKPTIA